ncbi:nuclear transport factor 2 family protein [Actinomadura darangshiensis]|nr:nuclear transport factor 2 family protein [Actinomadura darangshiensis]
MTEINDRTSADTASVDALLNALYESISGPAGDRDFDRLRALLLPGARLIPTGRRLHGDGGVRVMDIDEWITDIRPTMQVEAFHEVEIARRTERFGAVAHVWSTYEARRTHDGEPFGRGINSFQLVHKDGRWWLVTSFWANETPDSTIPEQYLEAPVQA